MKHIGIYSGTFDPIHDGHIDFALNAITLCKFDSVIFLPEKNPRNKHNVTDFTKRLAEITTSLKPYPELHVHNVGVDQFTIGQTLPILQSSFPNIKITFLLGSDVVLYIEQWEHLSMLLDSSSLAIGMRDGETKQQIIDVMEQIAQIYRQEPSYTLVDTSHGSTSSSQLKHKKRNA